MNDLRCCINVISDQSAAGVRVLQESSSKALQSFLLLCYRQAVRCVLGQESALKRKSLGGVGVGGKCTAKF